MRITLNTLAKYSDQKTIVTYNSILIGNAVIKTDKRGFINPVRYDFRLKTILLFSPEGDTMSKRWVNKASVFHFYDCVVVPNSTLTKNMVEETFSNFSKMN